MYYTHAYERLLPHQHLREYGLFILYCIVKEYNFFFLKKSIRNLLKENEIKKTIFSNKNLRKKKKLSEVGFEPTPGEPDCDLNAAP